MLNSYVQKVLGHRPVRIPAIIDGSYPTGKRGENKILVKGLNGLGQAFIVILDRFYRPQGSEFLPTTFIRGKEYVKI